MTGQSGGDRQDFVGEARLSRDGLVPALLATGRALQEFNISRAQANNLQLSEYLTLVRASTGDGVTAADAGRVLGLRRSSMTALADRLERKGLIRRVPHATDRRLNMLQTTRRGERLLEKSWAATLSSLDGLLADLDPTVEEVLIQLLAAIGALLREHTRTTRP